LKKIAYQGVSGAYSHLASYHAFPNCEYIACRSFDDAMYLAESGQANIAMIPMENSTAGRVEEIYRLIPKMNLYIIAEHFEPVHHCLLALPNTKIQNIKYVSSHPQALAQCRENILKYNLEAIAKLDTAGSAKDLLTIQDNKHAAIASSLAAEIYGLEIIDSAFEDLKNNTTRFLVLSPTHKVPKYQNNKVYITSLVFEVKNIPAALYKALGGFATNGVNIIKIESYTMGGTLKISQFHIDIEGHPKTPSVKRALDELAYFANSVKMIGTYLPHPLREQLIINN